MKSIVLFLVVFALNINTWASTSLGAQHASNEVTWSSAHRADRTYHSDDGNKTSLLRWEERILKSRGFYQNQDLSQPFSTVYRVDRRPLEDMRAAGGMLPHVEAGLTANNGLISHLEGESGDSNFVSTAATIQAAVNFGDATLLPHSDSSLYDPNATIYIYRIRPAHNFYGLGASLEVVMEATPDRRLRRQLYDLLWQDSEVGDQREFAALGGFGFSRIMDYAELTAGMIEEHGIGPDSPLFRSSFWESRWVANRSYNSDYDNDTTSPVAYSNLGEGTGMIAEVRNGTSPTVPLRFTCHGVSQLSFDSYSTVAQSNAHSLAASIRACPRLSDMKVEDRIYDSRLNIVVLSLGASE